MKSSRSPLNLLLESLLEPLLRRYRDRPLSTAELHRLEESRPHGAPDPLAPFFAAYRAAEPSPARLFDWPAFWARLERETTPGHWPMHSPAHWPAHSPVRSPAHSPAHPSTRVHPPTRPVPLLRRLAPVGALLLVIGLAPVWLGSLDRLDRFGRGGSLTEMKGVTSVGTPDTASAPFAATPPVNETPSGEVDTPGLTGTSTAPLEPGVGADSTRALTELAAARERWARAGAGGAAPSRYSLALTRVCYCLPEWSGPFRIGVRDGVSTVIRLADDGSGGEGAGEPVTDPGILAALPLSAEALFRFIEERIGQEGFRADYDERTGLPLSFWSDPIPGAADDELGLLIEGITVER